MPWKSYVYLLLVYIMYLFIGAMVFSHLESDAETKRCEVAKEGVKLGFQDEILVAYQQPYLMKKFIFQASCSRWTPMIYNQSLKILTKMKKAEFGQKYFYIFGLNLKFCRGIRRYKEQLSEAEYNHQKGLRRGNDCSGSLFI